MSFVANNTEQLSFFDSINTLTEREKRFLNKSWAKYFSENIFPKIDEQPYAVLYSKKDSRPYGITEPVEEELPFRCLFHDLRRTAGAECLFKRHHRADRSGLHTHPVCR